MSLQVIFSLISWKTQKHTIVPSRVSSDDTPVSGSGSTIVGKPANQVSIPHAILNPRIAGHKIKILIIVKPMTMKMGYKPTKYHGHPVKFELCLERFISDDRNV